MMTHIRFDIVHHVFHLNVAHFDPTKFEERREKELDQLDLSSQPDSDDIGSFEDEAAQVPHERAEPKIGRNEECSCGSGKKYKKCCGSE
jgi:preprotein translocase subunit SecA